MDGLNDGGLLTVSEVARLLQVSRATVFNLVKRDVSFPRQLRIGRRVSRWVGSELAAWLGSRPRGSYGEREG